MISFENFVKMSRKSKLVKKLANAQTLAWAYERAFGEKLASFENLPNPEMQAAFKDLTIDENGLVQSEIIGDLKNLKSLSQIQIDTVESEEMYNFYNEVYEYGQVWSSGLDPIGIVMNVENGGVHTEFFMTPLPKLEREMEQIKNIVSDAMKEELDFVKNPKIRKGLGAIAVGIDLAKAEKKADEELVNGMLGKIYQKEKVEFLRELEEHTGLKLSDLGGEAFIALGSLPKSVISLDLDIYGGFSFADKKKAAEFTKNISESKLVKNLQKEFDFGEISTEKYKGNMIYITPKKHFQSFIFSFDYRFVYTVMDNFIIVAPNREAIQKVIDIAKNPKETKNLVIQNPTKKSFLFVLVDGKRLTTEAQDLIRRYQTNILDGFKLIQTGYRGEGLEEIGTAYLEQHEYSKLLGKNIDSTTSIGVLKIEKKDGKVHYKIDKNQVKKILKSNKEKTVSADMDTKILNGLADIPESISLEEIQKRQNSDQYPLSDIVTTMMYTELSDFLKQDKALPTMTLAASLEKDEISLDIKTLGEK